MEEQIARITHEAYGEKQTIEFSAGSNIHEYLDYIERILIAAGFHPESVKCGFFEKAEEIVENDKEDLRSEQESE